MHIENMSPSSGFSLALETAHRAWVTMTNRVLPFEVSSQIIVNDTCIAADVAYCTSTRRLHNEALFYEFFCKNRSRLYMRPFLLLQCTLIRRCCRCSWYFSLCTSARWRSAWRLRQMGNWSHNQYLTTITLHYEPPHYSLNHHYAA